MIIAIAVSSNLQGAATLVGDTTAILLGGYANMNFLDFFFYLGKPSIFFAVELGALCAAAILLVMFREGDRPGPRSHGSRRCPIMFPPFCCWVPLCC